MAQLITVKLSRFDGAPWGFRLQGGKDFAQPLCIQKVNGGSPAEKAGLQAGDALVKLNEVDLFSLRHKEAQDAIVRGGNSFEITIQRGGGVWKPAVLPVGNIPKPKPQQTNGAPAPVTKTSLIANTPQVAPIGSSHNNVTKPFGAPQMNGGGAQPVKSIANKQYNTPVGLYSEENIAETLSAQAEVLAGGVLGVNFKKNEKTYQPNNSEVLRMVQEGDLGPREPEPEDPAFSPGAGLRKVTTPVTAPTTQIQAASPAKTQLPPGQNICSECERLIVGVFVRIKEKNLHVECFKCATCGASLKNVGYYNIGTKLYCDVHAKNAARQQQPGPNMDPITVAPGQRPPPNAISAALASSMQQFPQAPAPAPVAAPPSVQSPQATNMAPLPFHNQAPPATAPVASAPKPFFAAPPPTLSSAAMNKPAGGGFQSTLNKPVHARPGHPKFVWPPPRPEDENPMITGPTATPIYMNPMEPTPMELPPPPKPLIAADPQGKPTIIASVKAPRPITPVRNVEQGPPVHPPMQLRAPVMPDRPVSPMVFALTTAPEQPYNIRASPSLNQGQKKGTSLAAQQQTQLPNFQPSFDVPPQPYHHQVQAPKPIHSVLAPNVPQQQQRMQQPMPAPAPAPAPLPVMQQQAPPPAPMVRDIPVMVEQRPAPAPVAPAPALIPAGLPAAPQVRQIPVQVEQRPAPARPISPLPQLTPLAPKQTFPPPAPMNFARPTSPMPPMSNIPAKQTFPPPAPLLSKALGSAMASAPKLAPSMMAPPPAPAPSGAGSAPGGGNPKGGSVAASNAPRRGRGVLTAPVTGGGRVPLCGMCQGQIRGPFITALGKTWCPDHFICVNSQCQRQLQDCGFVEEKGELYCEYCFEQFLAPPCEKCRKKIKGDCLNAIGKHFHPECFVCAYCSKLFGNNPFFLEDGLPYCESDWNELFTTKCFACGFPIEAGDRWVEALNNNYHSQCFNCTNCKKNLEGQSFFAKQGRPFCKAHAR